MPITKTERVITDKKMNEFVSEQPHNIPSGIRRTYAYAWADWANINSSNDKKPH
jgi:hypothetical protein